MAVPMEIRIEGCVIDDGPSIGRNNVPAFWQDPSWRLVWDGKTLEYVRSQAALRGSANLLKEVPRKRHQKAVDVHTGELVGYARWLLPEGPEYVDLWPEARVPDVPEERRKEAEDQSASADWIPNEALSPLDRPVGERKKELTKDKNYLVLEYLAVHPDHQRRGIGSALVKSGVAAADSMGLDCFVHAYQAGMQAYYSAGFVLLDNIFVDDTAYGGPGYDNFFMERPRRLQS